MPNTPDLYGTPMITALKTLQWTLSAEKPAITVSWARLNETLISEMKVLVSAILKKTAFWRVEGVGPDPVPGFHIPDLPDFSLSMLADEPWITDATLAAILCAWLAQRDMRGFEG